jgi:hypothetical protein
MSQVTPVRMVLRYREQPFQDLGAMVKAFFDWQDLQPLEDYCTHICCDPPSPTLYLVIDLHCKTCRDVDLSKLELQVFKVSKNNPLCVASPNWYDLTKLAYLVLFRISERLLEKRLYRDLLRSVGEICLIRGIRRRVSFANRTDSRYIRVLHIESQFEISRKPGRWYAWIVRITPFGCTKDNVVSIHVLRITQTRCVCLASPCTHCVKGKRLTIEVDTP